MSKPVPTLSEFGDLIGTVEIDGHLQSPLKELAALTNMPEHYCPVGLEIELFDSFDAIVHFSVLAYDSRIIGCDPNNMTAYVDQAGSLPIQRFPGMLRSEAAHRFFKHFSIVALDHRTVHMGDRLRVIASDDQYSAPYDSQSQGLRKAKPR